MEIIDKYIGEIGVVEKLAIPLLNNTAKAEASKAADELKQELNNSAFVKIPFVGEFNASKSSLINAYMGINLLPTNITPETAVSYELYYAASEKLDVWHYDTLKQTATLDKIAELNVVPGDIVKVYINNDKIKHLNDKGIVLVDMPGIDSGVEEHNNAILNYIQEGTFYVIVSDIQHGTLTGATLQFVKELKKYSISAAVLISKIDRKTDEEIANVTNNVRDFASKVMGPDTFVGAVSALTKNISDMEKLLGTLNGEDFAKRKYQDRIDNFINKQIAQLEFQANLLASTSVDFDSQIKALEKKREDALARLSINDAQAQPVDDSVEQILDEIKKALFLNSFQLANAIYNNSDAKALNNLFLSIIRPVLVKSFKDEMGEYQEALGQTVEKLADDIEAILKEENNPIVQQAEDIVGNLVTKEILEDFLQRGIAAMVARFAAYKSISGLLRIVGEVLNPLIGIIIGFLPDIIRMVFGKGKSAKLAELQQQLENVAYGQIVEAMREPVTNIITEQRQVSYNNMKKLIEDEVDSINKSLSEAKTQKEQDQAKNQEKIEKLKDAVSQIKLELGMDK